MAEKNKFVGSLFWENLWRANLLSFLSDLYRHLIAHLLYNDFVCTTLESNVERTELSYSGIKTPLNIIRDFFEIAERCFTIITTTTSENCYFIISLIIYDHCAMLLIAISNKTWAWMSSQYPEASRWACRPRGVGRLGRLDSIHSKAASQNKKGQKIL